MNCYCGDSRISDSALFTAATSSNTNTLSIVLFTSIATVAHSSNYVKMRLQRRVMASSTYTLLTATMLTAIKEMGSGRNKPVLAQCEVEGDRQTLIKDFVIKLRESREMTPLAFAKEIIAALLAQHFGIRMPEPALVEIPIEVSEGVINKVLKTRIAASVGLNFGTIYIDQSPIFRSVVDKTVQEAINIFTFDMLIQNLDRKAKNPNLLETSAGLFIYDHELAFGFTDPFMVKLKKGQDPWDFSANNVNDHVMWKPLQSKTCNFDDFIHRLAGLSDELIEAICDAVPAEWRTDEIKVIANFLRAARTHAPRFKQSLQEAVS